MLVTCQLYCHVTRSLQFKLCKTNPQPNDRLHREIKGGFTTIAKTKKAIKGQREGITNYKCFHRKLHKVKLKLTQRRLQISVIDID